MGLHSILQDHNTCPHIGFIRLPIKTKRMHYYKTRCMVLFLKGRTGSVIAVDFSAVLWEKEEEEEDEEGATDRWAHQ